MDNYSCVYLVIEREFLKTNENIYKIGYSTQPNLTRFMQYPKGSKLLFQMYTEYAKESEKEIINTFALNFIRRCDIGKEYFEGDYKKMRTIILNIVEKMENNKLNSSSIKFDITTDTIGFYDSFIEKLMECRKCLHLCTFKMPIFNFFFNLVLLKIA